MAVTFNDEGIIKSKFKERDIIWLWNYLYYHKKINLEHKSYHNDLLSYLIGIIKFHYGPTNPFQDILKQHKNMLVGSDYIKWINKNDKRLIIWLYMYLKDTGIFKGMVAMEDNSAIENYYSIILSNIDIDSSDLGEKETGLTNLKNIWANAKTPLIQTKWINVNDVEQLDWTWEYLKKLNKNVAIPSPANDQEKYSAILASLDRMSIYNDNWRPADKELFMQKIRKAWSQKKFREADKVKKPYHLPLTKQAKKQLDWLAQFYNTKNNIMLETLIKEKYELARLDEDGKALY